MEPLASATFFNKDFNSLRSVSSVCFALFNVESLCTHDLLCSSAAASSFDSFFCSEHEEENGEGEEEEEEQANSRRVNTSWRGSYIAFSISIAKLFGLLRKLITFFFLFPTFFFAFGNLVLQRFHFASTSDSPIITSHTDDKPDLAHHHKPKKKKKKSHRCNTESINTETWRASVSEKNRWVGFTLEDFSQVRCTGRR